MTTVWLIAAALTLSAPALAASDQSTERKELEQDTCSALMLATCGRAPHSICSAEDNVNQGELRARWARTDVLCRRYKDRYGAWLSGCCDYMKQREDRDARKQGCYDQFRAGQRPENCEVYWSMWSDGLSAALGAIDGSSNKLKDPNLDSADRDTILVELARQCSSYVSTFNEPAPLACR